MSGIRNDGLTSRAVTSDSRQAPQQRQPPAFSRRAALQIYEK